MRGARLLDAFWVHSSTLVRRDCTGSALAAGDASSHHPAWMLAASSSSLYGCFLSQLPYCATGPVCALSVLARRIDIFGYWFGRLSGARQSARARERESFVHCGMVWAVHDAATS